MIKKAVLILLSIFLCISMIACNVIGGPLERRPEEEQAETPENIEKNINEGNIQEDKELTEKAEKEKRTEKDQVVPQEDVRKNKEQIEENGENEVEVTKEFNTTIPTSVTQNLKYKKYSIPLDYFLVTTDVLNIRQQPKVNAPIVYSASYFEKLNLLDEVKGEYLASHDSDVWYHVFWKDGEEIQYGFVFGSLGQPRTFRFDKMIEEVEKLQNTVENHQMAYIFNYQNVRGLPPEYKGKTSDAYERDQDQSAPGYTDLKKTDFRYFPDGMLVAILDEKEDFYKVQTPSFEGEYWIPQKYVQFGNAPEELTKVIVIDDTNQNEGVFEWSEGKWHLISYTFATTGVEDEYKFETPKGHFMAIQKREQFLYLQDGTDDIGGYAPYAIRFSGGGYVHGIPVDYEYTEDQKKIDPGHREYLVTVGTTPRSHKCVRNYTSHAKFLYDWMEIGKGAIIIIE